MNYNGQFLNIEKNQENLILTLTNAGTNLLDDEIKKCISDPTLGIPNENNFFYKLFDDVTMYTDLEYTHSLLDLNIAISCPAIFTANYYELEKNDELKQEITSIYIIDHKEILIDDLIHLLYTTGKLNFYNSFST